MRLQVKEPLRDLVSGLPFSADLHWMLLGRQKPFRSHFNLDDLRRNLPEMTSTAAQAAQQAHPGKKIYLFATLHYWIQQAAAIGLALAGQGHQVSLGYLPYADWDKPLSPFNLRRQELYARDCLRPGSRLMPVQSLLGVHPAGRLSEDTLQAVELVSRYDTQYTSQSEEVDTDSPLYRLRHSRNLQAAKRGLTWLQNGKPDLLVVPNGTILELGVLYRIARLLGIPVVTYEFNDQRGQAWLALDDEIMRQDTTHMWQARSGQALTAEQKEKINRLETARMGGRSYGRSERLWQNAPSQGSQEAGNWLGLDERPVTLLATNVLGDSLTLGREKISSMSAWISRTVQFFAGKPQLQLVVRIHPGEQLTHGPSMLGVIESALPQLPENIHIVKPAERVNTYDLIELASLGLVYTTTTGLEMAMQGIPVIVAGDTHYRNAGFCLAPETWQEYETMLETCLADLPSRRLSQAQVDLAWNYAYRFFFEFPQPFPWRVVKFWDDYRDWPMSRVLSAEGELTFGRTFRAFSGEALDWNQHA